MFLRAKQKLGPLSPKTPLTVEPPNKKGKTGKKVKKAKKAKKAESDHYVCQTCSKEFKRACRYENHLRLHTGEVPFSCSICDKRFRSAESLSAHRATHTDSRIACSMCSGLFTTVHQLRKHQRLTKLAISRGDPNDHAPVKCKLCTAQITSRSEGRQHMHWHRKKKQKQQPYVCSFCKEGFNQLDLLGQHERSKQCMTLYNPEGSKDCSKCRKIFRQDADPEQEIMPCRLQHIHQLHNYSKTPSFHACHVCSKKFTSSPNLGKHLATHFDLELYKCDSCRMEFKDTQSLKEHICSNTLEAQNKPILVVKFLPPDEVNQAIMAQHVETSDSNYEETISPFNLT